SHAAGVGEPLGEDVVRAMMLLRANALARGASGCQPAIVDTLVAMLNAGVTPVVPSQGSCGSSGDLAPLSHLGLVIMEGPAGEAWFRGERLPPGGARGGARVPRPAPSGSWSWGGPPGRPCSGANGSALATRWRAPRSPGSRSAPRMGSRSRT